jgi:hypothetical protein
MSDGQACNSDGIRHPQSVLMVAVRTVIPEAINDPAYHEELKREVMMGRSFGYDNSPIMAEPETIANTMPNPSSILAMMYIAAGTSLDGISWGLLGPAHR